MSPFRVLKLAWAAPNTLAGLPLAALAVVLGGRAAWRDGTLEAAFGDRGPAARAVVARLPFNAIALGHVVVAASPAALERLRDHERAHVAQAERWGPLFIPAYLGASAWAWLRRGDPYRDNVFEVQARLAATTAAREHGDASGPPPA